MGNDTRPSIHHWKGARKIILMFGDPNPGNKFCCLLHIYSDKRPFNLKCLKTIPENLIWATFSHDRRSDFD